MSGTNEAEQDAKETGYATNETECDTLSGRLREGSSASSGTVTHKGDPTYEPKGLSGCGGPASAAGKIIARVFAARKSGGAAFTLTASYLLSLRRRIEMGTAQL